MNSQGRETNTILTNLSNYLTLISSEPYSERKLRKHGLPALRVFPETRKPGRRGVRPLHQSTLSLAAGDGEGRYLSTMKESFMGRNDVEAPKRAVRYPSLHRSQFNVGYDSQHNMVTSNNNSFKGHPEHACAAHVDRTRWINQMAGFDMISSTRQDGSSDIDLTTTYSQDHPGLQCDKTKPDAFSGRWRSSIYNICPGDSQCGKARFHSISGNHFLSAARKKSQTRLLC